jgi:hypothetical protein
VIGRWRAPVFVINAGKPADARLDQTGGQQ